MTRYILAGGADKKYPAYARALVAEIRKTASGPVKVLACMFAKPREEWEIKFPVWQQWWNEALGPETQLELAFPDVFAEQIKRADVVYLCGGDDALLAAYLEKIADLTELWKDKIVIGSSAGAGYLAKSYWTCDWRQVRSGSEITDFHIIPHFESEEYGKDDPRGPIDWQAALRDLQATLPKGGQVTVLHESEFVVVAK
jgi:hypothetical protein